MTVRASLQSNDHNSKVLAFSKMSLGIVSGKITILYSTTYAVHDIVINVYITHAEHLHRVPSTVQIVACPRYGSDGRVTKT